MKIDQENVLRWVATAVAVVAVVTTAVAVGTATWGLAAGGFVAAVPAVAACSYLWGRWFNRVDNAATIARTAPRPVPDEAESGRKI